MQQKLGNEVLSGQHDQAALTEAEIRATLVSAYGKDSTVTFAARMGLAESYATWRQPEHALVLASETLADLQTFCQGDEVCSVGALVSLARVQILVRQWTEAVATADRAQTICANAPIPHSNSSGLIQCDRQTQLLLARVYEEAGAYEKATRSFLAADSFSDGPRTKFQGIERATLIGRVYLRHGAYPEALFYLQRCLDETLPHYRTGTGDTRFSQEAARQERAALPYDDTHYFYSQAPPTLEDVVELSSKLGDENRAKSLVALQRSLWAKGPDVSKALTDKVEQTETQSHSPFLTAGAGDTLGCYYAGKEQYVEAIAAYEAALARVDRMLRGEQAAQTVYPVGLELEILLGLGGAYEGAGRLDDAERVYRRAIPVATEYLPPNHAWRLEPRARLAHSLEKQDRNDEALAEWRRYLLWAREVRGTDHADYAFGLAGEARALAAIGHFREAAAAQARAEGVWAAYNARVHATNNLPLPAPLLPLPTAAN